MEKERQSRSEQLEEGYQTRDQASNMWNPRNLPGGLNNISSKLSTPKMLYTIVYCISFWNFGVCVAIFGPTLLDLACQTSSSIGRISLLYFFQNLTCLLGCFISGMVVKRNNVDMNTILMVSSFLMLLCVAFMSVASNVLLLGILMLILGFNMGCIDNIANLAILKLHLTEVSPYIQTMHFFYGFGAFLTPIVVKIFGNQNVEMLIECLENENAPVKSSSYFSVSTKTKHSFWILALIQLPAPLLMFFIRRHISKNPTPTEGYFDLDEQQAVTSSGQPKPFHNDAAANNDLKFSMNPDSLKSIFQMPVFQLTFFMSLVVFFFEGLQATHGGLVYSYVDGKYENMWSSLNHPKTIAKSHRNKTISFHNKFENDDAYITASFWAFFFIGRFVSIFISKRVSPAYMLMMDMAGCVFSTVLMLVSSMLLSIKLLFMGTCLLGLFLSNTAPTSYSLTEIELGVTPSLTTMMIVSAAFGEMVFPLIGTFFFETIGPDSLMVVEILLSAGASLAFLGYYRWRRHSGFSGGSNFENKLSTGAGNNYSKMVEEND